MTATEHQHMASALRGLTDADMVAELERRRRARLSGLCPCCGRPTGTAPLCDRGFEHCGLTPPRG